MSNANLIKAARAKNDEFYTQRKDIERELEREEYRAFLIGKTVYCNCDDYRHSQFYRYFSDNFAALNLKKLIATGYSLEGGSGVFAVKSSSGVDSGYLAGDGDFRSAECAEFLAESDVVITNPPFSLFREYVAQLVANRKKFVILGNVNAITYKEIFKLIMEDKIWLGVSIHSGDREFRVPDYYPLNAAGFRVDEDGIKYLRVKGVRWYTNIPPRNFDALNLTMEYAPELYPRYDNYDAIEVSRTAKIPRDYPGVMGVPITFLDKYNPALFEIVGNLGAGKIDEYNLGNPVINGKAIYKRLLIRRR